MVNEIKSALQDLALPEKAVFFLNINLSIPSYKKAQKLSNEIKTINLR